ncbi:hypothetical protein V8G61_11945 [Gaetbulibacter sp. M240]|uniref:hypothetical protein n=1 Tax=Gaetbulibacter sp. M240 TaxID=3126511 RepID=UPI00374FC6B7
MKKSLLTSFVILIILSCSTRRQMEKAVSVGNYDQAIESAIERLRVNKDKRSKSDIIVLLQDSYNKASERDINDIKYLKTDNNPETFIQIYDKYVALDNRQERIKPLLPLYVNGREVNFNFKNYNVDIVTFKNKASDYMYDKAQGLLNTNNKLDAREAYNSLSIIENINPNYRDVNQLRDLAHLKGADFVLVDMVNESGKVIPQRLENDLLNFSSYGLNNFWTIYHSAPEDGINYNYNMKVGFRQINISPEQIKERQLTKEKQIVDGKKELIKNGKVVKDSLGNVIKVDNYKTVSCTYYEFKQFKATQVVGNVEYYNVQTNQLVDAFPISSEFVFEHIYATANGDRRALATDLIPFLERRAVPFPTEEQMIYDTGEDLKLKLKSIINSYTFN